MSALVDTGSAITVISNDLFKQLQNAKVIRNTSQVYTTANNGILETIGLGKLEVQIDDRMVEIRAEISKTVCTSIILGKDWCYENEVVIDFRHQRITIHGKRG